MNLPALQNRACLWFARHFPIHAGRKAAASLVSFHGIPNAVRFRTSDGVVLDLDLSDVQPREIFLYGYTERSSVRWFKRFVKPGMTVVDAGANIGQYTFLASKLVGNSGSVHAFEPHPGNFMSLERNLALNPALRGPIRMNQCGLGDKKGKARLYSGPEGYLGAASIVRRASADTASFEVEITTLDDYVGAHALHGVDFLKLDVEGYELKVLLGARKMLARKGPMAILCELNRLTLTHTNTSPEEIVRLLEDLGFRSYSPRAFPLPLTPARDYGPDMVDNALFVRS